MISAINVMIRMASITKVVERFNFREFTEEDYYGLAGATPFEDGSKPWIGTLEVSSWDPADKDWHEGFDQSGVGEVLVIWDASGIQLHGVESFLALEGDFDHCLTRLWFLAYPAREYKWPWKGLKCLEWVS